MCIKQTWRFPRLFFYPVTRENYGRYRASVDNPVRLSTEHITPDVIFEKEPVQWAITTPLYNIGEHAANLSDGFREAHSNIP